MLHYNSLPDIYAPPNKDGCYVDENGTKRYYMSDKLHRIGGPAIEWYDGSKKWFRGGVLHRIDGPAIEYVDDDYQWYLFGYSYTEDEYNQRILNLPLLYWNNRDYL